jgi:hypothetical protein
VLELESTRQLVEPTACTDIAAPYQAISGNDFDRRMIFAGCSSLMYIMHHGSSKGEKMGHDYFMEILCSGWILLIVIFVVKFQLSGFVGRWVAGCWTAVSVTAE